MLFPLSAVAGLGSDFSPGLFGGDGELDMSESGCEANACALTVLSFVLASADNEENMVGWLVGGGGGERWRGVAMIGGRVIRVIRVIRGRRRRLSRLLIFSSGIPPWLVINVIREGPYTAALSLFALSLFFLLFNSFSFQIYRAMRYSIE